MRFSEIGTKEMLKISDFYCDNQKIFIPKKIEVYQVPWITLISAKRWRLDVLTFLIHGFAAWYPAYPLTTSLFYTQFLVKFLILGAKTNPVLLIRVPQKNAKFEILKYGCGPWRLA
jgi:hypothetical protein